MNFTALLVINLILIIISVILIIADRVLVSYGNCKITVKEADQQREIVVRGGNYLLTELKNNGIQVTSSCGGKSTCGYCKVKVLNGGGPLLPTEEIFMSKEERQANMRIACAVKVKNDIQIEIPDFFTTVRSIVANKRFDAKLRWRFSADNVTHQDTQSNSEPKMIQENVSILNKLIDEHKKQKGALVPVMHSVNEHFGYLPEFSLKMIADELHLPISNVYRVATFYTGFSLTPRGKNRISVCLGTACHVRGSADVLNALEEDLGIKEGQTTPDCLFTLEGVRCLGCCSIAPVMTINGKYYGNVKPGKVKEIVNEYRS